MNSTSDRHIRPQDQELVDEAERVLDSGLPVVFPLRELILELVRTLLDQRRVKEKVEIVLTPEQTTALDRKLYDRIAAVVSKTYAELGDAAKLADDEAVEVIRELLLNFDPNIIDRNRFRNLKNLIPRKRR